MSPDTVNPLQEIIESLIYTLYPAIQFRFILITSDNDLDKKDKSHYIKFYHHC